MAISNIDHISVSLAELGFEVLRLFQQLLDAQDAVENSEPGDDQKTDGFSLASSQLSMSDLSFGL